MNIHDHIRRGFLFDTDEGAVPGITEDFPIEVNDEIPAEEPVEETPVEQPQTITLSADELDKRIQDGIRSGFQSFIQQAQEEQAKAQQRPPAEETPIYDPAVEAVNAVDARYNMIDEALDLHPDLPTEAKKEIRQRLGAFKTAAQIQQAMQVGLHETIANDVTMKYMKKGEYVPSQFVTKTAPRAAPTGGNTGSSMSIPGVPPAFVEESKETFALLGLGNPTEKDIKEAWALQNGGTR